MISCGAVVNLCNLSNGGLGSANSKSRAISLLIATVKLI